MARATHSQEALTGTSASFTEEELNDPDIMLGLQRPQLGLVDQPEFDPELESDEDDEEEEESSDGTGSSQSFKNESKSSESNKQEDQQPAPTTENPSSQTEQADSSANSTGGAGRTVPRKQSSSTPAKKANPRAARVRSVDDEFDDFE